MIIKKYDLLGNLYVFEVPDEPKGRVEYLTYSAFMLLSEEEQHRYIESVGLHEDLCVRRWNQI